MCMLNTQNTIYHTFSKVKKLFKIPLYLKGHNSISPELGSLTIRVFICMLQDVPEAQPEELLLIHASNEPFYLI